MKTLNLSKLDTTLRAAAEVVLPELATGAGRAGGNFFCGG